MSKARRGPKPGLDLIMLALLVFFCLVLLSIIKKG